MAYCQRCDETLERGTYCPDCGSELVQPTGRAETAAGPPDSGADGDGSGVWEGAADPERSTATDESDRWIKTARPPIEEGVDYYERGPVTFSFTFPLADGWETLVITAGLLILAGVVVFPYVFVYGYAYRLGRAVIRGDHRPPAYGDWVGLFGDGLRLLVVALPFGVLMTAIVLLPRVLDGIVDAQVIAAVTVPLFFVGIYVGAGLLPTFMATGSVRETYRGLRFFEFVSTTNHLKAMVVGFVTFVGVVIALAVTIVALLVTLVGIFATIPLILFVQPLVLFFPFLLLAYYYRDAVLQGKVSGMENGATLSSSL